MILTLSRFTNKFKKDCSLIQSPDTIALEKIKYSLIGYIVHDGISLNEGHYKYYIKSPHGYMSVSDNIISKPVKDSRSEAYIYVYKRFTDSCDVIVSESATKRTKLTASKDKKRYYV